MAISNRDYLVSLGFETNIKEIEEQFDSVMIDAKIDAWANAIKGYEKIAKSLGRNITELLGDLSSIKSLDNIFTNFITQLRKIGVELEQTEQHTIKVTKAFTGMGKELIEFKKDGTIIKDIIDNSEASLNINKGQDIQSVLEKQTDFIEGLKSNIAGADKTTKENFKKEIAKIIQEYGQITSDEETKILKNLEQYTSNLKVEYDKQGQLTKAWVDVQIDEYTRLRQAIRIFKAQDTSGKTATAFERIDGPSITRNYESMKKDLDSLLNTYVKLQEQKSKLEKDSTTYQEKDQLKQVNDEIENTLKKLDKFGVGFDGLSGKLVEGISKVRYEFAELPEEIDKTNQKLSQIDLTKQAKSYDKFVKEVSEKYKELEKLQIQLSAIEPGTNLYEDYKHQIDLAKKSLDDLRTSLINDTEAQNILSVATLEYESHMKDVEATIKAKQTDKTLEEEIKNVSILGKEYEKLIIIKRDMNAHPNDFSTDNLEYVSTKLSILTDKLSEYGIVSGKTFGELVIDSKKMKTGMEESTKAGQKLLKLTEDLTEAAKKQNAEESQKKYNTEIKKYIDDLQELYKLQSSLQKMESGKAKLDDLVELRENIQKVKDKLEQYSDDVKKSTKATEEFEKIQTKLATEAKELENNINRVGVSFGSLFKRLKESAQHALTFGIMNKAVDMLGDAARQSVEKIRELDTEMTNIQLVTGQTDEEVRQLMNTYSQMAKQLGATTLEVSSGSLEWFLIRSFKISLTAGNSLELYIPIIYSNII